MLVLLRPQAPTIVVINTFMTARHVDVMGNGMSKGDCTCMLIARASTFGNIANLGSVLATGTILVVPIALK